MRARDGKEPMFCLMELCSWQQCAVQIAKGVILSSHIRASSTVGAEHHQHHHHHHTTGQLCTTVVMQFSFSSLCNSQV